MVTQILVKRTSNETFIFFSKPVTRPYAPLWCKELGEGEGEGEDEVSKPVMLDFPLAPIRELL